MTNHSPQATDKAESQATLMSSTPLAQPVQQTAPQINSAMPQPAASYSLSESPQIAAQSSPVITNAPSSPPTFVPFGDNTDSTNNPMSDRNLSNLLFAPLQGQIVGTSGYTFSQGNSDNYSIKGLQHAHGTPHTDTFTQGFSYGVTNDWSISLTDSYEFGATHSDNTVTGSETTFRSSGFTNPVVGLTTYRFLDQQKNMPVDGDVVFSYSPNMLPYKISSAHDDGTEAAGRQVATAGVDIGRPISEDVVLQGIAGVTYYGKRKFQYVPNNQYGETDPYWAYAVGVSSQIYLTDEFSITPSYRYTIQDQSNSAHEFGSPAQNWLTKNPNMDDFGVALKYLVTPNVTGQLSYNYKINTHSESLYSTPASDSVDTNIHENEFGVQLQYALY